MIMNEKSKTCFVCNLTGSVKNFNDKTFKSCSKKLAYRKIKKLKYANIQLTDESLENVGYHSRCLRRVNNIIIESKENFITSNIDVRSVKRVKPNRPLLPLRPQDASTSAATYASISATTYASTSKDITENPSGKPPFDIFAKLLELYEEENEEEEESESEDTRNVKYNTLLLEKLVARERLNTLIVNLYPGNKGYSLAFRPLSISDPNYTDADTANMIETEQWPYEEDSILRCIDNEELPPSIIDLIEYEFSYLFYNGCIIAEVRDYRQAYPHFKCETHHVLLRPTQRSMMADINNMTDDKTDWGSEEKDQLESQMLMANEPNLCLDPDSTISRQLTQMHNRKFTWCTHKYRRMAQKFSQVTANRKRKLDQFTHRPGLELYEFLNRNQNKPKIGATTSTFSKPARKPVEEIRPVAVPNLDSPAISPPSQPVVINEFKTYQRPKETGDCLPQLIEEYVLETDMPSKDRGVPRIYHIKLSILQRPSNSEYLGELYLDRDHNKNEQKGVACRFPLGSRANANRYIHQFTEIFTESGRKSVRIRYGLSPGFKERVAIAQAQQVQQPQNGAQSTTPQQHLQQLSQSLLSQAQGGAGGSGPSQPAAVNGSVSATLPLQGQSQGSSSVPILKSHLQGTSQVKQATPNISTQELAISALAIKLENSAQQFQAAANAKQQQQQQQKISSSNPALINILNSSPTTNINSDAVINAITNSPLLPQQVQNVNQKILARKMMLPNNARVINHGNLLALNNNRISLQELSQQPQTITLTSVNNASFANFRQQPANQQQPAGQQQQVGGESNKSALSALLVGTPAADRPDIVGPNTSSLLLEKLGGTAGGSQATTHFVQGAKGGQFVVQSSKGNSVLSPMSSPPPQTGNTINVQSLNFAQLQSIPGLQNLQVQLQGFAQPISLSLNVSSTGTIQGHPTSLLVSVPATTATHTANSITQSAVATGIKPQTVVLTNAGASGLSQLVSSNAKGVSHQAVRTTSTPQAVSLTQGGQQFQIITPLQRPRVQQVQQIQQVQQASTTQPTLKARTVQGKPITIKVAAPNSNDSQVNLPSSQLQKQAQLQQYQQICLNHPSVLGNRRRSNTSDPQ